MPYLDVERRNSLFSDSRSTPQVGGDLNFLVADLVNDFLTEHGLNYANLNTAIGALECCKLEIYRRIVVPYEDTKIFWNGDVFSKENLA